MNNLHISITFYQVTFAMDTGIISVQYIYLESNNYYVNLIRTKSEFAETLSNAWKLSTKFDLIQNLLSPITLY